MLAGEVRLRLSVSALVVILVLQIFLYETK